MEFITSYMALSGNVSRCSEVLVDQGVGIFAMGGDWFCVWGSGKGEFA